MVDWHDETQRRQNISREIEHYGSLMARQQERQEEVDEKIMYAFGRALSHSDNHDELRQGIAMLEDLIDRGYKVLDCRLLIAEAYYDLAEFRDSRMYCERVLRADPRNRRAQELHDQIKMIVSRKGTPGLVMIAGLVAAAVIGLRYLLLSPDTKPSYRRY